MALLDILRTPDDRFGALPDFSLEPSLIEVPSGVADGPRSLRISYVETGPADADPVLLLHGEPSWSFLYRHMIPVLVAAGHRVIAPDLVGFGRSDKPTQVEDHTYGRHVAWMAGFLEELDVSAATLFCQDWGGLIGLRLLAQMPDRFARTVAANTGMPVGNARMPEEWQRFRNAVVDAETLDIGRIVASGCRQGLSDQARAAYDAPFPDESYKSGPRAMPDLIPQRPDDPSSEHNRAAWQTIAELDKPFMVAFSDSDPITGAMRDIFLERVQGTHGRDHPTIAGAGHFLQEDAGTEVAEVVNDFIAATTDT